MTSNQSRSRIIAQPAEALEEKNAAIIAKQSYLISLYESIRSDYVNVFQHLSEIDEKRIMTHIDKSIVSG